MDWMTDHISNGNFIDAILCLKQKSCNEENKVIDEMCLPLVDDNGNDRCYFYDALDFIDDVVSSGERILVHYHAGRSRSVCIVLGIL